MSLESAHLTAATWSRQKFKVTYVALTRENSWTVTLNPICPHGLRRQIVATYQAGHRHWSSPL